MEAASLPGLLSLLMLSEAPIVSDSINSAEIADSIRSYFVEDLTTTGLSPLRVTYEHTKPGEYGEIFVTLTGSNPSEDIEVTLINPDNTKNTRTVTADENGTIAETFRIYQFGSYHVRAIPAVSKLSLILA